MHVRNIYGDYFKKYCKILGKWKIQIYTYCRNSSDMTKNKNQKPILPDKPCTVTAFLLESNIMGSVEGLISEESE